MTKSKLLAIIREVWEEGSYRTKDYNEIVEHFTCKPWILSDCFVNAIAHDYVYGF